LKRSLEIDLQKERHDKEAFMCFQLPTLEASQEGRGQDQKNEVPKKFPTLGSAHSLKPFHRRSKNEGGKKK